MVYFFLFYLSQNFNRIKEEEEKEIIFTFSIKDWCQVCLKYWGLKFQ
jgi:hypothetical protein